MKKLVLAIVAAVLIVAAFGLPPFSGGPSADGLLGSGKADFRTGVLRQANGVYEVSAVTPMPGVTAEMVRWWFGDYMQTTEHYKRWHPTAHVWMDWENKKPGEYIGASHLVHEYIGKDLAKLRIQFVPIEDILGEGLEKKSDVAVCARAGELDAPINVARMCHIIRNTESGAEMHSRFWMGIVAKRKGNEEVRSIEGVLGNTYLVRMILLNKAAAVSLRDHALQEMSILAKFLPELYAAESGN